MSFLYQKNILNKLIEPFIKEAQSQDIRAANLYAQKLVSNLDAELNNVSSDADFTKNLTLEDLEYTNFLNYLNENAIKFENKLVITNSDNPNIDLSKYNAIENTDLVVNLDALKKYLSFLRENNKDNIVFKHLLNQLENRFFTVSQEEAKQEDKLTNETVIVNMPNIFGFNNKTGKYPLLVKNLENVAALDNWLKSIDAQLIKEDKSGADKYTSGNANICEILRDMYSISQFYLNKTSNTDENYNKYKYFNTKISELIPQFNFKGQACSINKPVTTKDTTKKEDDKGQEISDHKVQNLKTNVFRIVQSLPLQYNLIQLNDILDFQNQISTILKDQEINRLIADNNSKISILKGRIFKHQPSSVPINNPRSFASRLTTLTDYSSAVSLLEQVLNNTEQMIRIIKNKYGKTIFEADPSAKSAFRSQIGDSPGEQSVFADNLHKLNLLRLNISNIVKLKK